MPMNALRLLPKWMQLKHQDGRPMWLKFRSDKIFIVTTISLAIFTDIFLYGLIVPIMPFALSTRAGAKDDSLQRWTSILIAVFGVGLFTASPIFGFYADHSNSRRAPLLLGLIALVGATAMFAVARSVALLAVARFLQGASGAVIWTVGLALVVDTVEPEEVSQMMGYTQIGMSFGILLGPLLGGIVYDKAGYEAVFALAFGVVGVDIILRLLLIEKKVAVTYMGVHDQDQAINLDGVDKSKAHLAGEPSPVHLPLGSREGADDIERLASNGPASADSKPLSAHLSAAPSDIQVKKRKGIPVPPVITMLGSPRLLNAVLVTVTLSTLMTSFDATLPLRTIEIFNFSSIGGGLIFLPIVVPSLLGPLAGWMVDRYGPRWFVSLGFMFGAPFFILLRFPDSDSTKQVVAMCAILFGLGAALVMPMPGIMGEFMAGVVDLEKQRPGRFGKAGAFGQSYALFNIAWAAGGIIGPIYGGFVRDAIGWNKMCLSLGLIGSVMGAVSIIYTGGKISKKDFSLKTISQREGTSP